MQQRNDQLATATIETETEIDRDARAIREKIVKQNAEGPGVDDKVGLKCVIDNIGADAFSLIIT